MKRTGEPSSPQAAPRLRGVGWLLRVIEVRFRFIILLAACLVVFGGWSSLQSRFDWLWRKLRSSSAQEAVVSSDTEYFCPMDPGVLSDWPEKCPICQMALVRRKKGEATALPAGVTARMQLTPERVQLAGVRTSNVAYQPLRRDLSIAGVLTPDGQDRWCVEAAIARADIPLAEHATAGESTLQVDGVTETSARVESLTLVNSDAASVPTVRAEIVDALRQLRVGQFVAITLRVPAARFEPFRALSASPPPLRAGELRAVYACANHPDTLHETAGKCPLDQQPLEERKLGENERVHWWCPMHPGVTAEVPHHSCAECNGMPLAPRVKTFAPPGTVLAAPESAVVDFGAEQIVYVERMPGMFDGVRVELGPPCDGHYPVLSGLAPGDRVVTAGAFLLDAETRLNPALANSYFGAGPQAGTAARATSSSGAPADDDQERRIQAALAKLSPRDRALADQQNTCPVTGLRLGAMGAPIKVQAAGQDVFVCCAGCIGQLERREPAKAE